MSRLRAALVVTAVVCGGSLLAVPAEARSAAPTCEGSTATIVGTEGDDVLTGTGGSDVIVGLGGNDVITGDGVFEAICGGDGDDTINAPRMRGQAHLSGGPGNDHIVSQAKHTYLDGGPGDDVESVESQALQYTPEAGTNQLTPSSGLTFRADFSGVASPLHTDLRLGELSFAGSLTTVEAPNTISTWTVTGTSQADTLLGSNGVEMLHGGPGDDVLKGRGGQDDLHGDPGADTLRGGSGDDRLVERQLAGVRGGPGNDGLDGRVLPGRLHAVRGGPGVNSLTLRVFRPGGGTFRHVVVDLARHRIAGDGKVTRLGGDFQSVIAIGAARRWTLLGTGHADSISSASPAVIHARGGDDTLFTRDGNDVLDGGPGHDVGDARGGKDTCISMEGPFIRGRSLHCEVTR